MEYDFKLQKMDLSVVWFLSMTIRRNEESTARVKRKSLTDEL